MHAECHENLILFSSTSQTSTSIHILLAKLSLQKVLKQNDKIFNSIFYKQLNNILRFLDNHHDIKVDKDSITNLIHRNETVIISLEMANKLSHSCLKKDSGRE